MKDFIDNLALECEGYSEYMIQLQTNHPIAKDSPDHLELHGTRRKIIFIIILIMAMLCGTAIYYLFADNQTEVQQPIDIMPAPPPSGDLGWPFFPFDIF